MLVDINSLTVDTDSNPFTNLDNPISYGAFSTWPNESPFPTITMDSEHFAAALRSAANAHHEYEKQLGHADTNWAEWYADYIVGGR